MPAQRPTPTKMLFILGGLFSLFAHTPTLAQSTSTESCPKPLTLDCDGRCVSVDFIKDNWQDGVCNNDTLNLDCPFFENDGGDCSPSHNEKYEIFSNPIGTQISQFSAEGELLATVEILGSNGNITTYAHEQQKFSFELVCDEQLQHCSLSLPRQVTNFQQRQFINQVQVTLMQILKNTVQTKETTFALKNEATQPLPKGQVSAHLSVSLP